MPQCVESRVLVEILKTTKSEGRELSRHFGVWCIKLTLESPFTLLRWISNTVTILDAKSDS